VYVIDVASFAYVTPKVGKAFVDPIVPLKEPITSRMVGAPPPLACAGAVAVNGVPAYKP
jgi:hypothetical protein